MYKVSSEIYNETNFQPIKVGDDNSQVISKFKFRYPPTKETNQTENYQNVAPIVDKDGDFILNRCQAATSGVIEIEHSVATEIRLVGLQVWRGALLLADFIFHYRDEFENKQMLELGSGVGLTSIAAAVYVRKVICTDIDIGGILQLVRANVARNRKLLNGNVEVLEYNFKQAPEDYSSQLAQAIDESEVIVAADVIYDDDLTDAFIGVIERIFSRATVTKQRKVIYVALEKRFVFTLSELDAVAPMFEYFLKQTMNKPWRFEYIPIDSLPQYFEYERCKQLVLLKLTCV